MTTTSRRTTDPTPRSGPGRRTVLVTGATGVVGQALVPRLLDHGATDVICLTHRAVMGTPSPNAPRRQPQHRPRRRGTTGPGARRAGVPRTGRPHRRRRTRRGTDRLRRPRRDTATRQRRRHRTRARHRPRGGRTLRARQHRVPARTRRRSARTHRRAIRRLQTRGGSRRHGQRREAQPRAPLDRHRRLTHRRHVLRPGAAPRGRCRVVRHRPDPPLRRVLALRLHPPRRRRRHDRRHRGTRTHRRGTVGHRRTTSTDPRPGRGRPHRDRTPAGHQGRHTTFRLTRTVRPDHRPGVPTRTARDHAPHHHPTARLLRRLPRQGRAHADPRSPRSKNKESPSCPTSPRASGAASSTGTPPTSRPAQPGQWHDQRPGHRATRPPHSRPRHRPHPVPGACQHVTRHDRRDPRRAPRSPFFGHARVRRTRQPVPELRGVRRVPSRAPPPGRRRCGAAPARHAHARDEALPHPTARGGCRDARVDHTTRSRPCRADQLRRGGHRARAQAGPPGGAHTSRRDDGRLPREDPRRALGHRTRGVPGTVPTAGAGSRVRAVRRRRGRSPRRSHATAPAPP